MRYVLGSALLVALAMVGSVILGPTAPVLGQPASVVKPKVDGELPGKGKVSWNLKYLEKDFTILRVTVDAEQNTVTWLVEAKKDVNPHCYAYFYDVDGVQIDQSLTMLRFQGGQGLFGLEAGERARASLQLPQGEGWKAVRSVILSYDTPKRR